MSRNSIAMRPSSSPTPYSNPSHGLNGDGSPATSHGGRTSPASAAHHRAAPPPAMGGLGGRAGGPNGMLFGISGVGAGERTTLPLAVGLGSRRDASAVRSHLRPLPQQGGAAARHGGGGLTNMMIQGHSAGEGRVLVPTEPRVPQEKKSNAAPLENGVNKEARDSAKLRRLETEVEKLKELLKKRTAERDKATTRGDELERQLAEARKTLADREAEAAAALREKGQQIIDLQLQLSKLEERAAAAAAASEKERKTLSGRAGEEADRLRAALEAEKAARSATEAALRAELASLQKQCDDANNSRRRDSNGLQTQLDELRAALAAKTSESSEWEAKAKAAEKELKGQAASFAEWRSRIEAINEYILKICQPQFSVVKDESLAPVTPGDTAGSSDGFVLVPLPLMLQGYGLLPQELKKKIATEYESNKKGLAAALPRRASGNS